MSVAYSVRVPPDLPLDFTVHRTTTAQQVADGLSDLIMSGRFQPGTRLRESAIATDLGVARNTVREAVRILELGGLVRHEVNRGAVVIAPNQENVRALYGARGLLEGAAARQIHESDTPRLEPVREALDRLSQAAETRQVKDIVAADLAFHAAVVGLLGNSRIDAFYRELTTELRFYLTVLSVEDREYASPETIVEEHAHLLRALESGDADFAARAIEAHIEDNARRVCEILARHDEEVASRDLGTDAPVF